ncbi:hypothetical protein [Aureivirga sp. CE67]|uniref:hypothetical protein n=1 Tax=Aureivirga sp. CE67 TaxID=1788983 RepID=UPI0018CBC2A6|nr:hypothetical protein [Aureivirga sp. CE67]
MLNKGETMKNIFYTILLLIPSIVLAQKTAIPDVNFQKKLKEININVENGMIDNESVKSITKLSLAGSEIKSLQGIEAFVNVKVVYCHDNQLTELDLSKNPNITFIDAHNNQISKTNFSNNVKLSQLGISNNKLTSLDLSKLTGLTKLFVNNNELTDLNLEKNKKLTDVYAFYNDLKTVEANNGKHFDFFDVSNNPELKCIEIFNIKYAEENYVKDNQANFSLMCR